MLDHCADLCYASGRRPLAQAAETLIEEMLPEQCQMLARLYIFPPSSLTNFRHLPPCLVTGQAAETLIEQMSRDQDPILRYGAM